MSFTANNYYDTPQIMYTPNQRLDNTNLQESSAPLYTLEILKLYELL